MPPRHAISTPRVWAISDPHWSTSRPMTYYHAGWEGNEHLIESEWRRLVHGHDLVLVPGDITFARDPHDDLARLHRLPGQKVVVPGNHDRWAQGVSRAALQALLEPYPTLHLLSHAHPTYETGRHLIVGYKGADPPDSPAFRPRTGAKHHNKAVSNARDAAAAALHIRNSSHHVIVTTHFPPSEEERAAMAALKPDLWLHGHSHLSGNDEPKVREWSLRSSPPQVCISSDYLRMRPIQVTGGRLHPEV